MRHLISYAHTPRSSITLKKALDIVTGECLQVFVPENYAEERRYILEVLLNEFLGLDFSLQRGGVQNTHISMGDERELRVEDALFAVPEEIWLSDLALPSGPLAKWDPSEAGLGGKRVDAFLPVIYGRELATGGYAEVSTDKIKLGIDLFGSAFFMLSRYEEAVTTRRDCHRRFPASASLAFKESFLDRPVVNEYIELLWECLSRLWPRLTRKRREFRIVPTHDVDHPFRYLYWSAVRALTTLTGDLIRRHDPRRAFALARDWYRVKCGEIDRDPFNRFAAIMDQSEQSGLRSRFHFIADHTDRTRDGYYNLDDEPIRNLMRMINQRGHEIGLHGSYHSADDPVQLGKELTRLRDICEKLGIYQRIEAGRQHFLRFDGSRSPAVWEASGLTRDSSMSFADKAGFRAGICYPYPLFDIVKKRKLKVWEEPLIAMECSVIDRQYMGLGCGQRAKLLFLELRKRCRLFEGDFVVLWHNSRLVDPCESDLYRSLINDSTVNMNGHPRLLVRP